MAVPTIPVPIIIKLFKRRSFIFKPRASLIRRDHPACKYYVRNHGNIRLSKIKKVSRKTIEDLCSTFYLTYIPSQSRKRDPSGFVKCSTQRELSQTIFKETALFLWPHSIIYNINSKGNFRPACYPACYNER